MIGPGVLTQKSIYNNLNASEMYFSDSSTGIRAIRSCIQAIIESSFTEGILFGDLSDIFRTLEIFLHFLENKSTPNNPELKESTRYLALVAGRVPEAQAGYEDYRFETKSKNEILGIIRGLRELTPLVELMLEDDAKASYESYIEQLSIFYDSSESLPTQSLQSISKKTLMFLQEEEPNANNLGKVLAQTLFFSFVCEDNEEAWSDLDVFYNQGIVTVKQ